MSRHMMTCKPKELGQEEESNAAQREESKDEVVEDEVRSDENCGNDNPAALFAIDDARGTNKEL